MSIIAPSKLWGRNPADAIQRERYRQKAWSGIKIGRALESRRLAHRRMRTDYRVKFCQAILALVEKTGSVRLFSHMYSGRIEHEEVGPCSQLEVPLEVFARDRGAFPVDTVVRLTRRAGAAEADTHGHSS